MQKTLVGFPGREDMLKKGQATHSNILGFACGSAGKESACSAGDMSSIPESEDPWSRERLVTPVFWPEEFHGLYSPWGHKESDTTE